MSQKLQLVVLACQQAAPEGAVFTGSLAKRGLEVRVIPEPCSSKVEVFQMLRILAADADLLWVVGCPEDACLFTEGSFRMGQRVEYARKYLEEIGLEARRLGMSRIPAGDVEAAAQAAAEMAAWAEALGPNPARPRPKP